MSTINTIHTLFPGSIPQGYLHEDNVRKIQTKIVEVLRREFKQNVLVDRGSIARLMERAISGPNSRIETIAKMNQRVVMYATNDFRNHQLEANKHMKWESGYRLSQRLYDPSVEVSRYDPQAIKLANRLGVQKVGGTSRFYFS